MVELKTKLEQNTSVYGNFKNDLYNYSKRLIRSDYPIIPVQKRILRSNVFFQDLMNFSFDQPEIQHRLNV